MTRVGDPGTGRAGGRAFAVWGVAVGVYLIAFFHRTSLGVAALQAQDRFSVSAAQLSTFTIFQLIVLLGMQIPAGLMADRFGPRRMLTAAVICMAAGSALFAVATSAPLGVLGRVLVGLGDSLTFLNVLRLVASWFPRARYALMASLTGLIGFSGQLLSTAPLALLLRAVGWTGAFLVTSGVCVVLLAAVLLWVRDHPRLARDLAAPPRPRSRRPVWPDLRDCVREPGTRLGIWTHFTLMSSPTVLITLWGYPYLAEGAGLPPATAGGVLGLAATGPLIGCLLTAALINGRPHLRRPLTLGAALLLSASWLVIVAWPGGAPPLPLIVTAVVITAGCGALAMLAFDIARDANPVERSGVASGLVNVGGFGGAVVGTLTTGVIIDMYGAGYTAHAFQVAFLPVAAFVLLGTARLATAAFLARVRSRRVRT